MDYSKKSKEELIEEINSLKKKEQDISLVLNNVSEMFYKISYDKNERKKIDYISPQVKDVFGLEVKEYIDNQSKLFEYFHPDELEALREQIANINENTKNWSITYRFYNKKKQKYVWIEETINTIYSKEGVKMGLFGSARDISEKKETEQKISFILENINECIYNVRFLDHGPQLVYISPQITKITGLSVKEYEKEGLAGKLINRIHPDDVEKVNINIEEGLYQKKSSIVNTTFRFKPKGKKEYIWIDENVHTKYKDGKLIETTTVLRDVTKEKQQQQQLIESEDKFSLLSNATNEVVVIHDKGIIKQANNAVVKMFGYKPSELIGKSVLSLADKDSIETVKNNVLNNYDQPYEAIGKKKNGEKFYGVIHAKQIKWKGKEVRVATIKDITVNKLAEKRLIENRQLYKNLFVKNLAGVFITENNKIIECNDSFAKIFGYKKAAELIGKSAETLYFSKEYRKKYFDDLSKKGFLTNHTLKHKSKNGEEVWIFTNVTLSNKKTKRIEGTLINITEQVKKEQLLRQSEKNFKELIEKAPYGTLIHKNEKLLYVNPRGKKILGITDKTKQPLKLKDFILPEYYAMVDKRKKSLLKNKELPFIDLKVKNIETSKIIDLESKSLIIEYQGENVIQVVFQDISDKKQLAKEKLKTQIAEESNKILQKEIEVRKKTEQQLVLNQNYTENIISSSLDIICATNENRKIREFNKAAELAFGYTKEEILNKSADILYKNNKSHEKVGKELEEKGFFTGEVINVRKNGEEFTSLLSASILRDEDGNITGTMGVSRDVTDIKLAEQQLIESEEKYRDLFENATDLIQSVDTKGNIVYVNKTWLYKLGYKINEVEHQNIFNFIHPNSLEACKKDFKEIISNKSNVSVRKTFDLKTKKGNKITVEGDISCKFDPVGIPISTRAILRDVTEENWAKTRQRVYNNVSKIISEKTKAEEVYEAIRVELGNIINTDIFVISYAFNKNALSFPFYYDKDRGGRIYRPNRIRKKGINEYFLKQKQPQILKRKELDQIIKKGEYELMGPKCQVYVGVPLRVKNKVIGVLSVQSYTNKDEYDEKAVEILDFISGALALAVQKKYDEQTLFEQSSKLESIIENSSHLFWTYDIDRGLTTFNQNFSDAVFELYGRRPKIKDNQISRAESKSIQPFWNEKYKEAFAGKKIEFITERTTKKGERIIREVFLSPILDENGSVVSVSGIAHDITEKKIAEEKLVYSLKEKEVLLKEVHHRVKNNLQVISSILNLQSSYVQDQQTLNILKESQDRIKSMSIIHESLYQTNDFSKVNFSDYIVSLSKNLVHSYGHNDNYIELEYHVEEVSLSLDTSIPCGLIVNELVSNALKYAFKGRKTGKIRINLSLDKGNVVLVVLDDGIGFPQNINYKETNSLGLQLVTTLVEQIDGAIEMNNNKGTKFTIKFKQA